jgi:hypothetical protein
MDKPFSMIYNETKKNILDVLNNCKLHPCVLLDMLTPIYLEVQNLANNTANEEQKQYLQNAQESTHEE